ncbi:hypothetical protein ME0899_18390, partial [Lactobacillus delbrueckii subsp. bulgaricus]
NCVQPLKAITPACPTMTRLRCCKKLARTSSGATTLARQMKPSCQNNLTGHSSSLTTQ